MSRITEVSALSKSISYRFENVLFSNARTLLPFRRRQVLGRAEEAWQMYRSLWVLSVGYRASYIIQSISRFSAFVFCFVFPSEPYSAFPAPSSSTQLVYCPLEKYKGAKSVAVTAACAHSGHSGRRKWCTNASNANTLSCIRINIVALDVFPLCPLFSVRMQLWMLLNNKFHLQGLGNGEHERTRAMHSTFVIYSIWSN